MTNDYILVLRCPDTRGVVAAVSGYLADNDCSIDESNHFSDPTTRQFYMRTVFRRDGPRAPPIEMLREGLRPIAHRFDMRWDLHDGSQRPRVMIAVSKF